MSKFSFHQFKFTSFFMFSFHNKFQFFAWFSRIFLTLKVLKAKSIHSIFLHSFLLFFWSKLIFTISLRFFNLRNMMPVNLVCVESMLVTICIALSSKIFLSITKIFHFGIFSSVSRQATATSAHFRSFSTES